MVSNVLLLNLVHCLVHVVALLVLDELREDKCLLFERRQPCKCWTRACVVQDFEDGVHTTVAAFASRAIGQRKVVLFIGTAH